MILLQMVPYNVLKAQCDTLRQSAEMRIAELEQVLGQKVTTTAAIKTKIP